MLDTNFATVLLFLASGAGFVTVVVWFNKLVAGSHPTPTKIRPYESGEITETQAWVQYNPRYYLFALLFVLFDVEAAFTIPWAVAYRSMVAAGDMLAASADMLIFVFVVVSALVYACRKGVAKWV